MSLKKTKKEISAEIAKSFARYFKESPEPCPVKWLRSADEDEVKNNSKSVDVHDEIAKNTRSSPNVIENCDCQQKGQLLVGSAKKNSIELYSTDFVSPENGALDTQQHDATTQKMDYPIADINKSNSTNQNVEDDTGLDNNDAASTVSDQLMKYITFYERQEKNVSSIEDKEFEDLIGTKAKGNDLQNGDANEASNDRQQMSTTTTTMSVNNPCIYDILRDAQDPMVFHICPKVSGSGKPVTRRMLRLRNESIFYSGPELRRCSIPLKDFRVRNRKPNPLEKMDFFVARPQKVKRLRRPRNNYWRQPRRILTVSKKKGKVAKRQIVAPINNEKVEQHASLWDTIQEAYPKPQQEIPSLAPEAKPTETKAISIEEKNVSINEWLELSSQVQPDNNVDVNEFLQYASLPILSDIEDEAYQLSTFLDLTDSINNDTRNFNNVRPIAQTQSQQFYDKVNDDLPLDLSMKQTTPMSTDTGFCNGSFSLDVNSPYHSASMPTQALHNEAENRTGFTNDYVYKDRSGEISVAAANLPTDPTIRLPSNATTTQTTEKQLCVVEPRSGVTSNAIATTAVTMPSETIIPPEVKDSRRVLLPSDWNIDNYSTDLDYEPSEDEDDDDDNHSDQSSHNTDGTSAPVDIDTVGSVDTDTIPQIDAETTVPVDADTTLPVVEPQSESCNQNVIEAASNVRSTRSVTRRLLSVESKEIIAPTVNVVEPQPMIAQETKPIIVYVPSKPISTQSGTLPVTLNTVKRPPDHLLQPASKDQIDLLKQQVQYLLNRICFSYLADGACSSNTCRKNHKLPEADEVLAKLKLFPTDTILSIYSKFIIRNRMAFINYFPTICTVFSMRKLKSQLIAAVEHCDQHNKKSFYNDIYRACVQMGMAKVSALTEIAKVSCKSTISCTYILNIIVNEDPEFFKQMLKDYYPLAKVDSHHMMSLLAYLSKNPEPSLLKLFVNIFNKYSRSDVSDTGPYKMIYNEIRSLVNVYPLLVRKLQFIVARDKRLQSPE